MAECLYPEIEQKILYILMSRKANPIRKSFLTAMVGDGVTAALRDLEHRGIVEYHLDEHPGFSGYVYVEVKEPTKFHKRIKQ